MSRSSLPFVSSNIPPDLRQFLDRVRESLDGDTYVRRADYVYGTVPRRPGEPPNPPEPPGPPRPPCGNPVTPTAPTGFTVAAGFSGFLLSWDMPGYCGHDRTEVYALRRNGSSGELTVVNMLGESKGVMYSHVVDKPDDYWCFWIRHVNVDDVEGPFNDTPGTCARTAIRPEVILNTLKGQITASQLYRDLSARIELIDVTEPLSELTLLAAVTGRVIRSATAPTNATVDPDLQAGDIWIETDAYYPGTTINKAYRYSGTAWLLLPATSPNQLSAAVLNETVVRADGDSIEASKREGLFAGAFAGIGNAYQYFIQEAVPTATKIGDIWAWRNPQTDAAAIFKRWDGSTWRVATPQVTPIANANVDANRRAATVTTLTGSGTPCIALPVADNTVYVIGDQLVYRHPGCANNNQIFVYTAKAAPNTWVLVTDKAQMLAAAMVYQEQYVRVDEDQNVLAQATELVYATAGDSRPNLCPNALFEEGMTGMGNPGQFSVDTGAFGARANWANAPASGGYIVSFPRFPISAGDWYGVTGDARMTLTAGTGSVGYRLAFYNAQTGGTPLAAVAGGKLLLGGTNPMAIEFSDELQRRQALWVKAEAPAGATWAAVQFIYGATNTVSRVAFRQATAVRCKDANDNSVPKFGYDSSSALVGDIATARIGYCTKRTKSPVGAWQTTADSTKLTCESGTHGDEATYEYRWNQGLPWSDAVKQVYVTTTDKCYLNGALQTGYTKTTCEAAGGSWVPGDTAALEQRFQALQEADGVLSAQYTVKIDVGGHVSGFGLSTEKPVNGTPFSQFGVLANRFFITGPTTVASTAPANPYKGMAWRDTSVTPNVVKYWTGSAWSTSSSDASFPFVVQATPLTGYCSNAAYTTQATCTANGGTWTAQNIPAGVYIDVAFIRDATITGAKLKNATIDDAKIFSLAANKITTGSIAVGTCIQSAQWYDQPNEVPQWRICGDGNALFNNVSVRGSYYGNATGFTDGGTGIFIGKDGGTYKLRVGDGQATPTGPSLRWNGSTLSVFAGGAQLMRFGSGGANDCFLRSANYVANTAGWAINGDGSAEFDAIHLRKGAVSQMGFVPPDGQTLDTVNLFYPTSVTQWASGTTYFVGNRVWDVWRHLVYVCIQQNSGRTPAVSPLYWRAYDEMYVDLATVTISSLANADADLGVVFFGRLTATATAAASPLTRLVGIDVVVRLVRVTGGQTKIFAEGGFSLAFAGLASTTPTTTYYYTLPISTFEYVGTTAGTFKLQAKNGVGDTSVIINARDIALGYIGTKR